MFFTYYEQKLHNEELEGSNKDYKRIPKAEFKIEYFFWEKNENKFSDTFVSTSKFYINVPLLSELLSVQLFCNGL